MYTMGETKYTRDDKAEAQLESPGINELPQLTSTTERKLLAKIDWHIVPVLCILYLLAFLDRVNISNAAIFGLQKDLDITKGTKYNTALTIFFVPYVLLEIPSNILLKKLKPHVWLSICMFGFGFVIICQGLVSTWAGLMTTRFFLGVFETGMFPGCFYLMGMWYKRSEAQKRFSFFFNSTTLAGAFGGLLASAIGKMDGLQGYHGWRWIFILEGTFTCLVAVIWFFVIPDFPEDVKWLTDEERAFVQAKLARDVGHSAHSAKIGWRDVVNVFKDYKIFVGGLMYFGLIVPAYGMSNPRATSAFVVSVLTTVGYAYFAPTIIKSYGYSAITTQLYSVAPWAAAFFYSLSIAYLSDRLRHRFMFALFSIGVSIVGFAILLNVHGKAHRHVEYGALFLVTSGCYTAMPVIVCWYAMNLAGHHRRSIGTAWQIGFGNVGGIIATYSFLSSDAKNYYRHGYIICLSFICLSAVSCIAYLGAVWRENRKRDRGSVISSPGSDSVGDLNTANSSQVDEFLGDLSPGYRYQY